MMQQQNLQEAISTIELFNQLHHPDKPLSYPLFAAAVDFTVQHIDQALGASAPLCQDLTSYPPLPIASKDYWNLYYGIHHAKFDASKDQNVEVRPYVLTTVTAL